MRLADRVALVTGAARGIGRAAALLLAEQGAAVAVNYRTGAQEAEEVVAEITAAGGKAVALGADVSDPEAAATLIEQTIGALGGLHILVNNAGIARDGLIFDMNPGDWVEVMRTNFGGVFNCTRSAMGHFMAQRDGVIVNVSSVMGQRGWIGQANYSASKAAINAFTQCSAIEMARFGVRVNAVLPGFTPTELIGPVVAGGAGKKLEKQIPLRSLAEVEQIAEVIAFLAGPGSAYMTGELVRADGGFAAQLGIGRLG
ncbi:SDR family oxidoreductase [Nocardia cyriacigeorgica]|uniref:3-oxoacyl-[acyl-carrier-protein] reductase MabA n=1 Tax=Nocardia cyriacigeorgica TaxID=135487 RepID=A0A4U8W1M9_9NOCA|nr:SDR family oxidoreductase [Nocardia cyriacigeorgica]MBF6086943.1 SDR family oxidoreductase [Nocardia cyriacigeorgica]MBF6090734.1 SDR family oxidoreductase [Nocardia cyriacigeorgica]MBF6101693.1 SDR family oxidoreductase [Nocardia cyriacigeorgica]MBF6158952.1 SDR family oxidoreductase [Nocardia cyriacigeorgica]MBF6197362.1 SDR family oxidoreductase [Nocardia cyriacigeorgica]